ncbi:uncharacterized protein LOC129592723 isoform X2 [Paramacrobiotus metropolitanus]|uniref:uncharacterized protein LOC129592723 isoform X2 n=1 Tax=Paramacrobiotus metropolitanus TaxID=2943436 RepID=UPI002446418A|nr:uncharacterized protein LOC129592723 isoform X2 [Paramacrobiotus metropolitanus]
MLHTRQSAVNSFCVLLFIIRAYSYKVYSGILQVLLPTKRQLLPLNNYVIMKAFGLFFGIFWTVVTSLTYSVSEPVGENASDSDASLYFNDVIWDDEDDGGARQYMRATGQLAPGNYWPNNGKDIPYAFEQLDADQRQAVEKALRLMEWRTSFCITFKSRTQEREHILFQPGKSCQAEIGRVHAHATKVKLHADCFSSGIIQHEVMHALGMFHEHSRPDRDEYVTVLPENIRKGVDPRNFDKLPLMVTYGVPYDLDSIMHYGGMDIARSGGRPAFVPKITTQVIGQRNGLSTFDVARLQRAYKCSLDDAAFERRMSERRLNISYRIATSVEEIATGQFPTSPVAVQIQPSKSQTVRIGDTVQFRCIVRSPIAYTTVWTKVGGRLLSRYSDVAGVLTINNVQPHDVGTYICTGSNAYQSGSDRAELSIKSAAFPIEVKPLANGEKAAPAPPSLWPTGPVELRIKPYFQRVKEGQPVEFRCIATGSQVHLSWHRAHGGRLNSQSTVNNGVLRIPSAQVQDEDEYFCNGTEPGGPVSARTFSSFSLSKRRECSSREVVRVECVGDGPDDAVYWHRDSAAGRVVAGPGQGRQEQVIENASADDARQYVCVVRDPTGTTSSFAVEVRKEARTYQGAGEIPEIVNL